MSDATPNQYMERLIKVTLLQSELIEIDKLLQGKLEGGMLQILLIKNTFLAVSNFVDFELTIRAMYKNSPELSQLYKKADKQFQFAKYIRNKFVGHIKDELIQKSIEWRPELKYMLDKQDMGYFYNLFILETVINTYVDNDGKHKVFISDTDLIYPSDMSRFLEYLYLIVQTAISFLTKLSEILKSKIEIKNFGNFDINDWLKAAKTDFKFIKK